MQISNEDNMQLMARYEDNHFDLAIVDPPYGIGMSKGAGETRGDGKKKADLYTPKDWDAERPKESYFIEVQRVSKNQIIWGGNYFADLLPASRCWLYWRKQMGGNYSDGELAWSSFDMILKEYTKRPQQGDRIHPTQKPVKLYEWLLMNYAKEGDKILDTHLGSGSIALACHNLNFDLTACELDAEYFNAAMKRLKEHQQQLTMF
tara:strand:+ start:1065 stop:1679 length:615 start_codon:yes stop_codon:yes gene_type:complete